MTSEIGTASHQGIRSILKNMSTSTNNLKHIYNRKMINGIQMISKNFFVDDLKTLINLDNYCLKMICPETINEISNEESSISVEPKKKEEKRIHFEEVKNMKSKICVKSKDDVN